MASKIEEIAQRVAQSEGLELVEVEVKGGGSARLVRIAIDKPEGVTHGDCEPGLADRSARFWTPRMWCPGHYTLEVSSPGVERKLLQTQGLRAISGTRRRRSPCATRWTAGATGRARSPAIADGIIALETEPGKIRQFPFEQVQKANLKFEW